MSKGEAASEAVMTEPEDYRRSVVWLVPYPAAFPSPKTANELRAAMQWAVGTPYSHSFMEQRTYDVFPQQTLRGMAKGALRRNNLLCEKGWCELVGAGSFDEFQPVEQARVIFCEATPDGIEVSAPYGDDFTHAITAAWAFALAESFGIDARPIHAEERHAWRESFDRN